MDRSAFVFGVPASGPCLLAARIATLRSDSSLAVSIVSQFPSGSFAPVAPSILLHPALDVGSIAVPAAP